MSLACVASRKEAENPWAGLKCTQQRAVLLGLSGHRLVVAGFGENGFYRAVRICSALPAALQVQPFVTAPSKYIRKMTYGTA